MLLLECVENFCSRNSCVWYQENMNESNFNASNVRLRWALGGAAPAIFQSGRHSEQNKRGFPGNPTKKPMQPQV